MYKYLGISRNFRFVEAELCILRYYLPTPGLAMRCGDGRKYVTESGLEATLAETKQNAGPPDKMMTLLAVPLLCLAT